MLQQHIVAQSNFGAQFNQSLLEQFHVMAHHDGVKKTHHFNGRFENIYLDEHHIAILSQLKADAKRRAENILNRPVEKMGFWFNAMPSGAVTTLHRHDDDDECLSGVYYVCVPEGSGQLIIHQPDSRYNHTPKQGQWVFFSPQTPHEVTENLSNKCRLSVAFNFS